MTSIRAGLRRRLLVLLDQLLPPPRISGAERLERRLIVGALAADSSWQLAEAARRYLAVDAEVGACRDLIHQSRRLFGRSNGKRHHDDVQLPGFRTYLRTTSETPCPPRPPVPPLPPARAA